MKSEHNARMGERSRSNLVVLALGVGLVLAGAVPGGTSSSTSPAAVSPAATRGRYVALGDSVPYGYGLANPGTKSATACRRTKGPRPVRTRPCWPSRST